MKKLVDFSETRSYSFWLLAGTISIGLLGVVDYLTGYEISFSLFYLAPIAAASWYSKRRLGWTLSILSALSWLIAELAAGQNYSQPLIYLWNTMIRFGFFSIVTYLVSELRSSHDMQRMLARTDYVSGAVNARHFSELLEIEMMRARVAQCPLTMVYIDLDNFKRVNDTFGHDIGDEVIRFITEALKSQLRGSDIVARLGGDEFALLLPITGMTEAQVIITRLHANLRRELQLKNWPITFSIGVVVCVTLPKSANELIRLADQLMYSVKNSTKNNIRFVTYTG